MILDPLNQSSKRIENNGYALGDFNSTIAFDFII